MGALVRWCQWRDWLYKVHVWTGLLAALWLLLVAVTGVLINHQEALGLSDIQISDQYLLDYYRPDYRTGTTPLAVLITDLHSGRIFGAQGHWVGDGIALLLILSLVTGTVSYWAKKRLAKWNRAREAAQPASLPSSGKQEWAAPLPEENLVPSSAGKEERTHVRRV